MAKAHRENSATLDAYGCKRLLGALLLLAIRDAQSCNGRSADALEWLQGGAPNYILSLIGIRAVGDARLIDALRETWAEGELANTDRRGLVGKRVGA